MFCISMGIKQPSAQVQTSNKVFNVTENKNVQILSVLTKFLFKSKFIHVCLFFFLYCSLKNYSLANITYWIPYLPDQLKFKCLHLSDHDTITNTVLIFSKSSKLPKIDFLTSLPIITRTHLLQFFSLICANSIFKT